MSLELFSNSIKIDLAKSLNGSFGNIFYFSLGLLSQQFPLIFKTSKLPCFFFDFLIFVLL